MPTYRDTLNAYLDAEGNSETQLASALNCSQASVNRYRHGLRFPDAQRAREIDVATAGAVPFSLWQTEFLERSGLAA